MIPSVIEFGVFDQGGGGQVVRISPAQDFLIVMKHLEIATGADFQPRGLFPW